MFSSSLDTNDTDLTHKNNIPAASEGEVAVLSKGSNLCLD